ncbi:GNAT family N-acetyltransferase [Paenibacillus tundrae]|uniref:RimJ/RimL family protein N-acetyltransferase n=1 Tax=Paenibacillus tundrae TaxID=528187 RepID=A0ABT9WBK3_9BACL|nr:GNAT family N-acetyltransferase [Paenibacillus tundrae]MDQ0170649.1 RimJ/RimL family protein N-acetyltransferase [Paenibacillus tundrae]
MKNSIRLTRYDQQYDDALANFSLTGEQFRFTAMPAEVIEEAIQNENKYPIVILHEDTVVGFFILHRYSEYADEHVNRETNLLIRALSISTEYQGKGYGLEAMQVLPSFVQQLVPDMNEIILAVNEDNIAAQKLYLKAGFVDTGRRMMKGQVLQFIFHYKMG